MRPSDVNPQSAGTPKEKKILGKRCDGVEAAKLGIECLEPKISKASSWVHLGLVATIGMAFFTVAALAAPIAEPLDTDLIERSTDLTARGEGLAFTGAISALEQRNSKKKCKRTNNKGYCTDSDDDKKDKKKKQCKRNKKGDCSDSDDDKKDKKKKQCRRNKKGNCSDDEDEKKKGNQKEDKKKNDDNKNDDNKNDDNKSDDNKNDDEKNDDQKNGKDDKGGFY
ncbi:hypothetical protein CTAM01_05456 [Colletotrichum tamarilloi]|uniref:Halomucin n=1 Tax=Colletotrichum tamarilloi TaxID=1209934 RepID=A0ABQ9RE39_9PEZI|nr:uncharacterized protein CTAM01_05456 [Colletotrichum tamarilloi]KAK1502018.1 hypothetical protein CTAM01_05456 [Colletotrichum tamarilloi]